MSNNLKDLTDLYIRAQQERIRVGNKISAIDRGDDQASEEYHDRLQKWFARCQETEQEMLSALEDELEYHPAWPWLEAVKGCGVSLGGKILGLMPPIEALTTPSKMGRAAGYGLWEYWLDDAMGEPVKPVAAWAWKKNGNRKEKVFVRPEQPPNTHRGYHRDVPIKGFCLPYNRTLKATLYNLGKQFLINNSPYRELYDAKKEYYQNNRPEWTPKHIDLAARRYMIKIFLQHLWEAWREAAGLPIRRAYVEEHLGHTGIRRKEEFVQVPALEMAPEVVVV